MVREISVNTADHKYLVRFIEPTTGWEDDPDKPLKADGSQPRRPKDQQEADRETGLPMWDVVCFVPGRSGGDVTVRVPSAERPVIEDGDAVLFENLVYRVWSRKSGG